MFKRSSTDRQLDLFSSFDQNLDEARREILNDPLEWHNLFFEHITKRIDESPYAVLYHETMGRPNASIRLLVSMLILKEGFGWSDRELFREVNFNLIVMKALGLANLNDKAPAQSTYYLFKNLLYQDQVTHGRNLIGETFNQLTKVKADTFGVFGDKVRMDAKLIGSNIANCSRLQLILACLQTFWKSLNKEQQQRLDQKARLQLDELCQKKPNQIVYPLSDSEKADKILQTGKLLLQLKQIFDDSDSDHFKLIVRLLEEQFEIVNKKPKLKPSAKVLSESIQSPYDTDAAYRDKNGQKVKGYHVNLTETCNELGPNLIIDVQVDKATVPEKDFVQPALENSRNILGPIKEVSLDGAYNSQDNREYAKDTNLILYLTGIQGPEGAYEFIDTPFGLQVKIKQIDKAVPAVEYKPGYYKIRQPDGKWRYFSPKQIESYKLRTSIKELPDSIRHRRNNVEASIFQLSYFTRNNKIRYRGHFNTEVWAFSRSIWNNLIRIRNFWRKFYKPPKLIVGFAPIA